MQAALKQLEGLVHPLVYGERQRWLQQCVSEGRHRVLVLDIPLLYETDAEGMVRSTILSQQPPGSDMPIQFLGLFSILLAYHPAF